MYRAWVALRDAESGKESGVQGFLKLSVTVLGPGDRQRVHDLAEEIQVGIRPYVRGRSKPVFPRTPGFACRETRIYGTFRSDVWRVCIRLFILPPPP